MCYLGSGCYFGSGCYLGSVCYLGSGCYLGSECYFGGGCYLVVIIMGCNRGKCILCLLPEVGVTRGL